MKLKKYLKKENITPADFAKLIGKSPATISLYISGDRWPILRDAQMIQRLTKNQVSVNDW